LTLRKVALTLSPEARAWLAEHGYDKHMGARPLARLIQIEVKDKLSDELLFGKLEKGGSVHIDAKESGIVLSFQARG